MFRQLIVLASTALITGALAGCGNTESWVRGARGVRLACPVRRRRQQQLRADSRRRHAEAGVDAIGQGRPGRRGSPRVGPLPGRQRANPWRLLADGVGGRQQCPPALVHPAGAGWRAFQSPLRWVRQPLHRPARRDAVVPADAVDPVAQAGDRNAHHTKDSRPRAAAGRHASRSGSRVRRAQRLGRRHAAGPGRRRRPDRLPTRTSRLPAGPASLPGGRRAGVRCADRHGRARAVGTECRRAGAGRAALSRRPDPLLTREWTSDAVGGGPLASPVLSADGSTIYVNGRDERLWALNSGDGKPKWSVPLDYLAQTPPSVSPDGLIVAGGGPGAKLLAVRDAGDRGEVVWTRDDVTPLSTSSQAGADVAYTVARDGDDGQALLVFDPADGHTSTATRCPRRPAFRSECRSATTAGSSPPPATARSTASRRSQPPALSL